MQEQPASLSTSDLAALAELRAGPRSDTVTTKGGLQLTKEDVLSVGAGRKPSRTAVHFYYCKLIAERFPETGCVEDYLHECVSDLRSGMKLTRVGARAEARHIHTLERLLLPVHHRSTDLWGLIVADLKVQTICYYSSDRKHLAGPTLRAAGEVPNKLLPGIGGHWGHTFSRPPYRKEKADSAIFARRCTQGKE
jgi:hypothetical protein